VNSWLSQGRPANFDLEGQLRASAESGAGFTWLFAQKHLAPDMEPGCLMFMWQAPGVFNEPSGVIATVVTSGHTKVAVI
jgi:hypothetical protein